MDVEITIDALHNLNRYEVAILFSGDADFLALVNYLKIMERGFIVFHLRTIFLMN